MTNNTQKIGLQEILDKIEKANIETDVFLVNINKRMSEVNLEYAKLLVKENIDTLKIAQKILNANT